MSCVSYVVCAEVLVKYDTIANIYQHPPTLPLEPLPLLTQSDYDDIMLLIELAILDVLLILTAFVCFTYVSNRNARVGAGAGILALGIAVTTTFPFFPVIGIGIAVSLMGLWILSSRLPQARTTANTEEVISNARNDDPSQLDTASRSTSQSDVSQSLQNDIPSDAEQSNSFQNNSHSVEH